MDDSGPITICDSTVSMVVDLTNADEGIADGKVVVETNKKKLVKQEVAMFIISDEEWLQCLPEKERDWYERNITSCEEIETRTIVCTGCFKQTNHKNLGEVSRHPTLHVPMCKNCKNFYFDGAWTKDEDGSFEFCGWCAQGGELLICAEESCPNSFCTRCIKRNLGRSTLSEIENCDDWKCFECKPKQIREQRALYYSLYKYWSVLSSKEDERKGRIRNSRLKGSRKNIKSGTSIQPIPLDETSDNSICDRNNSYGNTSDPSINSSKTPSTISECLRYAKEVSDIFSSSIKSENAKWNSLRIADKKSNVVDEETVWKQAKRVAKMVAIQNKNLDRLVELVMVNTSKECPSHDVTELKYIAKTNANTTEKSSPCKDITIAEGVKMAIDCNTTERQKINLPDKGENETKEDVQSEPIPGPSGAFKLTLRKDLFEEIPSKKHSSLENENPLNPHKSHLELSLYDPKENPIATQNMDENVSPLTPPHDDCTGSELREVDSAPPDSGPDTKKEQFTEKNNSVLQQISESPILVSCSLDFEARPTKKKTPKSVENTYTSSDVINKSNDEAELAFGNKQKKILESAAFHDTSWNKETTESVEDIDSSTREDRIDKGKENGESTKADSNKNHLPVKEKSIKAPVQKQSITTNRTVPSATSGHILSKVCYSSNKSEFESQEPMLTFVEIKKKLELQKTQPYENNITTSLECKNAKVNILRGYTNAASTNSSRSSDESSNKADLDFDVSTTQKSKRIKKKRKKRPKATSNDNSSDDENGKLKPTKRRKVLSKRAEQLKEERILEQAKASVLASTSEEDNQTTKNTSGNIACYKSKALGESEISNSFNTKINSAKSESIQKDLITAKKTEFVSVDIYDDKKLKQKVSVELDRLPKDTLAEVFHNNRNRLNLLKHTIFANYPNRNVKTFNYSKEDCEVDRLCELGSLRRIKCNASDMGDKNTEKAKIINSNALQSKRRSDKDSTYLATMSSDDNDTNKMSSTDTEEELQKISNALKNGIDSKMSVVELAKAAVLETSSSDENNEYNQNGDSGIGSKSNSRSNGNAVASKNNVKPTNNVESITSNKTKNTDPTFLRMKLSESDVSGESEDEQKTEKRRNKLEEEKRMAKLKRRIISSDEEIIDEDDVEIMTPSKNANVNNANGNEKPTKKSGNSSDDQSSWSSDDGKKGKNKIISHQKDNNGADSDSDIPLGKRNRKGRKNHASSDTSSDELSDEEPRPNRKRKRIKNASSSDDGNKDEDKDSPHKRKNIRKIMGDKKLCEDTVIAAVDERERKKRMEDKQKVYNELFETEEGEKIKELPLDFDEKTKEVLVQVDPYLLKNMKPHQGKGIKFMWDAVFESKKDFLKDKIPGGAILAHCMGLGKTLQTIGLIHSVMTTFPAQMRCVLVLAPVNTLKNWVDEFHKWLRGPLVNDVEVYEISGEKDNWGRADRLDMWKREGGVMIMGYDMFRNLTKENDKKFKRKQRAIFKDTLMDPGPQMVVCDEGHLLKNTKSALNAAMNKISTKRRIILTGTPLQNNLGEYFAMIDFVKPKLLGSYNEFKNRFVNPIQNGQHSDSTDRDVRVMKKRSFILSDLLKGCMQRLDYNVLTPYLQPKHEYVLCICLTEFQKKLYKFYLQNYAQAGQIGAEGKLEGGKKGGLFYDVTNLSRVWNHPYILLMAKHRDDEKRMFDDDDDELKEFVVEGSDEEEEAKSTSEDDNSEHSDHKPIPPKPTRASTRSTAKTDELVEGLDAAKRDELASDKGWWNQFLDRDCEEPSEIQLKKLSLGSKMILLMDILKEAETVGDKVLVFSQSLLSLDLIQEFLRTIDESNDKGGYGAGDMENYLGSWHEGRDYYRMDGSTSPDIRKRWCNYFNKISNHRMRLFLISTRAGGLGINLVAANRVIIFDASWNPAHDVQSIFRVYRFGQEKPVYCYRFLAKGTMEHRIYDRQVTKQSLSARVVDEQQIERHFTMNELAELYTYIDEKDETRPVPKVPKDMLLAELLKKHGSMIWSFHDHDSLLENQADENLTEEERKAAWEEFENEKKGVTNFAEVGQLNPNLLLSNINPAQIQSQYRIQYPHLTDEQVIQATRAYIMQVQSGITRKPAYDKSHYQQEMAKAKAQQQMMYPGLYQRTNNTTNNHGSVQQLQQQQQNEYAQAQQIQQQYLQAQAVQMQALQRAALIQNLQQQVAKNQSKGKESSSSSTKGRQEEPITLSSDDEMGSNAEATDLDGDTEVQAAERPIASASSSRRGRPRLDPDTDDILG